MFVRKYKIIQSVFLMIIFQFITASMESRKLKDSCYSFETV